jgi:hypothetical protein
MANSYPQLRAGVLALGGSLWALFLAVLGIGGGWNGISGVALRFGIGFLIWVGWTVRAFGSFRFSLRMFLWMVSIAYHAFCLFGMFAGFKTHNGELPLYWWGTAMTLSVVALVLERRGMPSHSMDPSTR